MQRTKHGQDGASPLNSVLGGPAQIKASIDRGAPSLQLRSLEFLTDFAVRYKDDPVHREVGEFSHEFLVKKGSILRLVR